MEQLDDNLILTGDEFDSMHLFDNEETQEDPPEEKDDEKTTTEDDINPDDLFDNPEGVSSDEDKNKEEEDTTSNEGNGSSPNSNFYYSIANALVEDGILTTLAKDSVKDIKDPEDFAEIIEQEINSRLDEKNRRITEALEADVETSTVRQYENVLNYLDSIKEESLNSEEKEGEELRQRLIFQDFINRGYSKERATREVKKSFDSGSDIEDAKDALASNKEFYSKQYEEIIDNAKKEAQAEKKRIEKEAQELKKSLLEDKEVFEGITLDKSTRQRAYEAITKPVHKTEDGEYLTAIQKYELDNPVEFRKKLSVIFTMTDGFKNLDLLVKGKVKKEIKNSLRELESTLKNTNRPKGNLTFIGDTDKESYIGKGWTIDI